mmetsp:Transcript_64387/g.188388  ORF Transcript_64387/g.188388 Transcript_64387/m.188388 type:complete len:152 (-) Transcript_64387:44-499(-)
MEALSSVVADSTNAALTAVDIQAYCTVRFKEDYPTFQVLCWFPLILIFVNLFLLVKNKLPETAQVMAGVELGMGGAFLLLGLLLSALKPVPPDGACTYSSFPCVSDWNACSTIMLALVWFQNARAFQQFHEQHVRGQGGGENPATELASTS